MRYRFPYARAGQTIGLLGGSFDPAHEGHALITREALKRFGLDQVWWLVSPGNPLKVNGPAPMAQRMDQARRVVRHPKVVITDIESKIGTRYTAATLQQMQALYPGVNFVWLMGADNLAQFDQWDQWRWIIENVSIGVLARPGDRLSARMSKTATIYARYRIRGRWSQRLRHAHAPAWCFVNVPMSGASSTAIRAKGGW